MNYSLDQWRTLPESPGVYQYVDVYGNLLYIGKAKNLRSRVGQYFLADSRMSEKSRILVSQIHAISTIETESEFDALLLESELIRTKQPKYNILAKDDKSPLYILLTLHEEMPRVIFVRKHDINTKKISKKDARFGPFQSGRLIRSLLKSLRYIIPFCLQKKRDGKPCFSSRLGFCDPCPSELSGMPEDIRKSYLIHQYKKNIWKLKKIFCGKSDEVRRSFVKEMRIASRAMKFEEALELKNHIIALDSLKQRHFDPALYISEDNSIEDIYQKEIEDAKNILSKFDIHFSLLSRIECIDISNTQGTFSTGALTVSIDGRADTDKYRRFRIRMKLAPNDVAMISEVLTRRLSHPEWIYPELFVIDGGKGQVRAAVRVLSELHLDIPVIGLAKRFETIIHFDQARNAFQSLRLPLGQPALRLFQRIRDEAHRFSKNYHSRLRSCNLLHS